VARSGLTGTVAVIRSKCAGVIPSYGGSARHIILSIINIRLTFQFLYMHILNQCHFWST